MAAAPAGRRRRDSASAALIGALDGLLGVALPFAVLAVVALDVWVSLGTPTDWTAFVRGAAVTWLLGHGVDVRFAVSGRTFPVGVAVLGPAVVTALCAVRAGRRAVDTEAAAAAWAALVLVTAVGGGLIAAVGSSAVAAPSIWQGVAAPAALVAVAGAVGMRTAGAGRRNRIGAGLRAGLAAAALVLAGAATAVGILLAVHLTDVVGLYEALGAGVAGGAALTVLQVLLLPTVVVWAAAWFTGAGFALGAGSVVGPFGTAVGPLPALPLLGALPAHPGPFAVAAPLVPMLAGLAIGVLAARRGSVAGMRLGAIRLGVVAGLVSGVALAGLALTVSGAAGPGRFAHVGPDPWLTGVLAAVEIGLPAMVGAGLTNRSRRRLAAAFERYSAPQ